MRTAFIGASESTVSARQSCREKSLVTEDTSGVTRDCKDREAEYGSECRCHHFDCLFALRFNGDFGLIVHVLVSFAATPDSMG